MNNLLRISLREADSVLHPVDKKPGSLLALTPLSVTMKVKVISNVVHVLVISKTIFIIHYPCIIRNRE